MTDRIEEIKARCEVAYKTCLSFHTEPYNHEEIGEVAESLSDIPYLLTEIERLTKSIDVVIEAATEQKELLIKNWKTDTACLTEALSSAIAERDAAVAQNKYIKTRLIELQEILTLFSEGKTTEGMLKSLVLLGSMRGVQK